MLRAISQQVPAPLVPSRCLTLPNIDAIKPVYQTKSTEPRLQPPIVCLFVLFVVFVVVVLFFFLGGGGANGSRWWEGELLNG